MPLDPEESPSKEGRYRFTLAHEGGGHWRLHRHLFAKDPAQSALFSGSAASVVCRSSQAKERVEERLGGASSVATMLRALGARVSLAGVIGTDADGSRVRQMLTDLGIDHEGVVPCPDRPTTVKERYIGRAQHRHPQQMIRVDYEERRPLAPALERELLHVVGRQMRHTDAVLISDYDKGVCTPTLLAAVIAAARACGVRVLADPVRVEQLVSNLIANALTRYMGQFPCHGGQGSPCGPFNTEVETTGKACGAEQAQRIVPEAVSWVPDCAPSSESGCSTLESPIR